MIDAIAERRKINPPNKSKQMDPIKRKLSRKMLKSQKKLDLLTDEYNA